MTTQNKAVPRGTVRNPYAIIDPKPCRICGNPIAYARANLGKSTCLDCQTNLDQTEPVKHLVAIPYNKGAYQHIHNPADLFCTNPKRTT